MLMFCMDDSDFVPIFIGFCRVELSYISVVPSIGPLASFLAKSEPIDLVSY